MLAARLTATVRLGGLVVLEAVAIPLLRRSGQGVPAVDWSHLGRWLETTGPDDAVVAVIRLAGMALAGWLLATTLLYLLARVTRVPALVRSVEWATLPGVRRVVDAAVAASIVGGAVLGAHPAGAQVPAPPIVVELDATTTTRPAHLYVPVPAGDRAVARTTTMSVAPTTHPPSATISTATAPVRTVPAPAPTPAPSATPAPHVHTVVAGDNLWTIAETELSRQTGRTPDHLAEVEIRNYWIKVIDANRGRLISGDPNLIYPGESVLCPIIA